MPATTEEIAERFRTEMPKGNNAWTALMEELYADTITVTFFTVTTDEWLNTPWNPELGPTQGLPTVASNEIPTAPIITFSYTENKKMLAFYDNYRFEDVDVKAIGNYVDVWWAHAGTFPGGSTFSDRQNFVYGTENGRIVSVTRRSTEAADVLHAAVVKAAGFATAEDFALVPDAEKTFGSLLTDNV